MHFKGAAAMAVDDHPKSNPRIRAWKEFRRAQDRLARQWRKERGLCIMFGCPENAEEGRTRCKRHHQMNIEAHARYMKRPFKDEDE